MSLNTELTDDLDEVTEAPRKPAGSPRIVLWLLVLGLGVLFIPLLLVSQAIQDENTTLGAQLDSIQQTLTSTAPPDPTEQALKNDLLTVRQHLSILQNLQPTLAITHVDWSAVMNALGAYDADQLTIISLTQMDNRIVVSGVADSDVSVMAYAETLRQSNQFVRVVLQAITFKVSPTPKAAGPVGAAAAATATTTPVPVFNDKPASFTLSVQFKADNNE